MPIKPDIEDVRKALAMLQKFPKMDFYYRSIIVGNVFNTNEGMVVIHPGDQYEIISIESNNKAIIGEISGNNVYLYGEYVIMDLPDFDYIKRGDELIYCYQDSLFRSTKKYPIQYELESSSTYHFGKGYVFYRKPNYETNEQILDNLKVLLGELEIHSKSYEMKESKLQDGFVSTSVSLDYGKGNWDKPLRFLEDVIQNHLNAGKTDLRYLVSRMGVEMWIPFNDYHSEDELLGFEVIDDGYGYTPEFLENLGKTDKQNPLGAGKYGEGSKMLLAAACRNLIDLEYESICLRTGQEIRWQAVAKTQMRDVVQKGQITQVPLVGFELRSHNIQGQKGSLTRVIFKDRQSQLYLGCKELLQRDVNGEAGLAAYILKLQNTSKLISNVGPVSFLDEPLTKIYENGLFVKVMKKMLGSYNVPDVTATRERDEINSEKFKQYVDFLFSHTQDETLIRKVLEHLVKDNDFYMGDVKRLFSENQKIPNKGLWMKVVRQYYPDYIAGLPGIDGENYLKYHGYNHVVSPNSVFGLFGEIFPTINELIMKNRLNPIKIEESTKIAVDEILVTLADKVLSLIDAGKIPEVQDSRFMQLLRDKERLLQKCEISRIHSSILGNANTITKTTNISESALVDTNQLIPLILHEWSHLLTGKGDLNIDFMACMMGLMLELANIQPGD